MEASVVMRRFALGLGTCLLLLSAQANPERVTPADLQALKELHQAQQGSLKELHQAEMDSIRAQAAALDKRVDDLSTHVGQGVDRLGVYASLIGTLVTVLLAGLGFLGYVTVTRRTKAEAHDAAKDWFEQKTKTLETRLQELEHKALQVHTQMDASTQCVLDHAEGVKKQQNEALAASVAQLQVAMGKESSAFSAPESLAAVAMVQERAEELKKNPEDSYSYDDWNTRAHAAYKSNQLEEAAFFWLRAAEVPNAGAVNVAKVLFNRGVTQGQLGQSEAAIATYDEVIRRFGEAPEAPLREQVARAMLNKGVAQGILGQSEAAIASFDEVIRSFSEAPEAPLREQVARAMLNKGVTQGQLGQSEAAIASFDEVIRRFGEAPEAPLREQVARAMVNKGVAQGQLGQSEAEIATYDEVIRRFGEAPEAPLREQVSAAHNGIGFVRICEGKALWPTNQAGALALWQEALGHIDQALYRREPERLSGFVLGNRAYALALLGDAAQAEIVFAKALRAPVDGGKKLYDGTLSDFDIHPIPGDLPMRELIERQWLIWQAEQGGDSVSPV